VSISAIDLKKIELQLGRTPRDLVKVVARGICGNPAVVKTKPRLQDGTPFPTLYYLTCPKLNSRIGSLEAAGFMKELETKLVTDDNLQKNYSLAHEIYLKEREAIEEVSEISGVSAGGMPSRVKCLHALAAHALAKGKGINKIGDMVLNEIKDWCQTPCLSEDELI
jgi:hypothetical protein